MEFYDPVVEELQVISKSLEELKDLISQQISIESANNFLLKKIYEKQNEEHNNYEKYNINPEKYSQGDLLIKHFSKNEGIRVAEIITSGIGAKLIKCDARSEIELASLISGLSDGDILFVDIASPVFNDKMRIIIYECVSAKCMNVLLGKGSTARNICLDIPDIRFIIYTYVDDYLPNDLKELLLEVK